MNGWVLTMRLPDPIPSQRAGRTNGDLRKPSGRDGPQTVGSTLPVDAPPGTIHGDFSSDSPNMANDEQRPVKNLVHASGDSEEETREIKLWFPDSA